MQVIHSLGILSINKNVNENAGFLLTNKKGGYCSFFNMPSSRYQGLFYFDEKTMDMYKVIENIEIVGSNNVERLKNSFYFAERKKENVIETLSMPKWFNSLIYELDNENEIDLILDCKASYDNREWGRYYNISEEGGCIIVKFTKKTDSREDATNGIEELNLFLAIKSNSNLYKKNDRWIGRFYSYDEERNSPPFRRYVYNALRIKGSKFVFSMSKNKADAIKECEYLFNNLDLIKSREKEDFFNILKNDAVKKIIKNDKISREIKIAYINAVNSLNSLIANTKNNCGLFAGLPWFFQFWARDTLISLKALSKINYELSKKLLFDYLSKINDDGRLPNLIGQHRSKNLGTADAQGWLFFRCNEIIEKLNKNKEVINSIKKSMNLIKNNKSANSARIKQYLKKCSSIIQKKENECHKTIYDLESSLEKSLNGLLKFHTKDGLEFNEALETWMDTEFENDNRKGIRIEIQALRLNMHELMFELTQNQKYKALENILKAKVKEKFWNGNQQKSKTSRIKDSRVVRDKVSAIFVAKKIRRIFSGILADGLNDFTIRPNIFIAAYVYPELLTKEEWETCFENALESLWLEWGGLATIDKSNPLYTDIYTGEQNIKSYHRGDSWFWVNNLAALVLYKLNNKKFNENIKKIIEASTEDILWKGCIGCHAELSSAKELTSHGCFNQAWSNAMFIEMVDEMF